MTTGTRWSQMWEVFHGALETEEGPARDAYMRERCVGDAELREKVERLLRSHGRAVGFLEPPARETPANGGLRLGRYTLRERIGEGGFAEVFLATQTEPVRRDVAVKVLRPGSERVLAMFEAERQTLAVLAHPNIATIFDAGVAENGRPYFVMEHIAGTPITRYCGQRRLNLRDRIDLFAQVCQAVQHAHHKGIIHRDLKPSNVLVTEVDGSPVAKVIDFGIATAMDRASAEDRPERGQGPRHTRLAGTPGYMSPEQAASGDVDTRTDVFSLGVLLYELLAGAPPFEAQTARFSEVLEHEQAAAPADPPPPSSRVRAWVPRADEDAARLRAEARGRAAGLRGDLDWIVLKALARERTRRYGSAAELAADLQRHVEHRPVAAAPAGAWYRSRKFVRRHRFGVGGAAAGVLLAIAGVIFLAATAKREARLRAQADQARDLAVRDARLSEQAAIFLRQEIVAGAAARPGSPAETAIVELLEAAEGRIEERYKQSPEMEAAVRRTIGDVYMSLGKNEKAMPHAERAVALMTEHLGADNRLTFQAINNLATIYTKAGRHKDAEPLYLRGIEFWGRANGPEARETLAQQANLASLYVSMGRLKEAAGLYEPALRTTERTYGPEDSQTAITRYSLGVVYKELGRFAEAELLLRAALEQQRAKAGEDHARTTATRSHLGGALAGMGRHAEAEPLYRAALAATLRRLGEDHVETATMRAGLANCLVALGRFEEAEPLVLAALGRFRQSLGEEHARTLGMLSALGAVCDKTGRSLQGEPHCAAAADGARKTLPESSWQRGLYLLNHGACLKNLGRHTDAEPRLLEAERILSAVLGPDHRHTREAWAALAAAYEATGRLEEAGRYRDRLGGKAP